MKIMSRDFTTREKIMLLVLTLILLAAVIFALRKELALLDVLTLGKEQAINLGVDD